MTLVEDLQKFQNKRRFPNWQPTKPNCTHVPYEGAEAAYDEIVLRCLDFVSLELQVGDWVRDAGLPSEVQAFLERNSQDEEKHERALEMLREYYGYRETSEEAQAIINEWKQLPEPTVVNAYALEMGVFFSILPALTMYGDVYASTVSQWINDDERVHVESALRIMREIGWKITESHAKIVGKTVAYIFAPRGKEVANFRMKLAVRRLLTAKDVQMENESVPTTIAFFEQHTRKSIVY